MKKFIYIVLLLCTTMSVHAQELLNYPLDTINGEEVYRYQVDKGIGLYRIGVNFNVSQSEIVRLNPQLKERGLHYAEILYIPTGRPVVAKPKVIEKPALPVSKEIVDIQTDRMERMESKEAIEKFVVKTVTIDSIADDSIATDSVATDTLLLDTRHVVELALMLPFESMQTKRSGNAERMMEFYQGALLALRDLQNDSTLYRLRVYDTERSERKVRELCDSTELDSVQGILGLVYPIQIEIMSAWCEAHHVPLLLPFCDEMELESHPHVLQFNSTDQQEADSLCAWLARQENIHCSAVEVREADLASSIRTLRKQMKNNGISYTGIALRDLMNDSIDYALDKEKENIIILHSDRFQHVRMLLPHLAKLQEAGYRIRIVSQYSWQKEKITLPQVYTSMFTVEGESAVYDAVWAEFFKNEHVCETPRYDLLGYDLMKTMIGWLHGETELNGLQSNIRWTQINNGGYQNTCVQVVTY